MKQNLFRVQVLGAALQRTVLFLGHIPPDHFVRTCNDDKPRPLTAQVWGAGPELGIPVLKFLDSVIVSG
jgi:hypothetical protein